MSAHTKGPWRVFGKMTGKVISENDPGMVEICEVGDFQDAELVPFNSERWNADARLISAAPELLEYLEETVALAAQLGATDMELHDARDVIAEARGAS